MVSVSASRQLSGVGNGSDLKEEQKALREKPRRCQVGAGGRGGELDEIEKLKRWYDERDQVEGGKRQEEHYGKKE